MRLGRQDPYGRALREYAQGNTSAVLEKRYASGFSEPIRVEEFFRKADSYSSDCCALERCRGRVLDVGAGTGQHALHLEGAGYEVTAIDVSPEAVDIMHDSGLADVRQIGFLDMPPASYDTLLFLGRTIGFCGTLAGLDGVLSKCCELTSPVAQVLLTSLDVEASSVIMRQDPNVDAKSSYRGEVRFRFVYEDSVGQEMPWLYIDSWTLSERAGCCGWVAQVLHEELNGNYLAKLTRAVSGTADRSRPNEG